MFFIAAMSLALVLCVVYMGYYVLMMRRDYPSKDKVDKASKTRNGSRHDIQLTYLRLHPPDNYQPETPPPPDDE